TADADDGEQTGFRVYRRGVAVIALCAVYLTVGWFNAHNVERTHYELTTDKELPGGSLRIAHIADSHIGTTFDGEGFGEYLEVIQAENPDVLLITGDLIDDSTPREEMLAACRQFSRISTTYGIYFVYGNHDKGYGRHGYDANELEAELAANGVTVMEDDVVQITDSVSIIGRRDRDDSRRREFVGEGAGTERMSMGEITQDIAPETYTVVLDHQPNDYDAQAEAGVDLVLSGHTHGGQLIPLGPIGRIIGANDRTYGHERRDSTDFIVTSGISDWEIDFKTGTKSEYVIIDITQENE
ncbi:MAG: metallophosphoesterase, partial [Ruminococcaceae bacterium]|nr:metallophosphoesterase [Oscillospiraceae bacterium]